MTEFAFLLLMQYVVSTKAGLVNHVEGSVNVSATESIEANTALKTGAGGFAEVLLNPGSFLRIGEQSEVVFDSVDLDAIALRVLSGSAVVEAAGVSKKLPITVTTRELTMEVIEPGIYVFGDGKAGIVQGKLRTADSGIEFTRGWQVDKRVAYRAVKLPKERSAPVEVWSQQRSGVLSAMNARIMTTYQPEADLFDRDIWLFSTAFGGYTFVPRRQYSSPYGQRYYSSDRYTSTRNRELNAPPLDDVRSATVPNTPVERDTETGVDQPFIRTTIRDKTPPAESVIP